MKSLTIKQKPHIIGGELSMRKKRTLCFWQQASISFFNCVVDFILKNTSSPSYTSINANLPGFSLSDSSAPLLLVVVLCYLSSPAITQKNYFITNLRGKNSTYRGKLPRLLPFVISQFQYYSYLFNLSLTKYIFIHSYNFQFITTNSYQHSSQLKLITVQKCKKHLYLKNNQVYFRVRVQIIQECQQQCGINLQAKPDTSIQKQQKTLQKAKKMMNDEETTSIGPYIFNEKYCIGQGSYGKVYRGKHNVDNEIVAIKEIDSNFVTEQEIQKQISILKQFQHPNIVKYKDTFENNGYFYIVTEFCNGGDLRNLMDDSDVQQESPSSNPQRVQQLLDMFFQVCEGFNYLKQFNIIHRDLKPSNILIHNGVYKIADFGVARAEKLHKSLIQNDLIGVPIYMSPQVLSKNFYTYKCDVWSLGVIFFQFFFEKLPWRASDTDRLFFQIMSHPTPYLEEKKKMPTMVKMILEHTLRYLQRERYSWSDLIALQKNRKKIFTDYTRTKSVHSQKKVPSYTDLSASKINNTIPKNEAELVNHIICQSQSQAQELQKLVGKECFMAFLNTSRNYLIQGYHYRQCFIDCGFFFLKIAGEKLHVYMIDLEHLEDSRQLLILLELVHDLVTLPENYNQEKLKNDVSSSYRNDHIETYAASVISKINTYRFSEKRI